MLYQMPLLQNSISFYGYPFTLNKNHKKSISVLGWNWYEMLLKRRRNKSHSFGATKRDSEFEVDPVKAREALRKLDEQLQSLAQKQAEPPKVRASELNRVTVIKPAIDGPFEATSSGLEAEETAPRQ